MPRIQLYLGKEGYAWAKQKPKGYLRRILDKERRNEEKGAIKSLRDRPLTDTEVGNPGERD